MSEELKPCPFCGGEPNLTHDDYVHDDLRPMPVVECKSCSAWVRAEDWNRRAQAQAAPEAEPVAWANWKVGTKSYVPYRSIEDAERCVRGSELAATQLVPYKVVPLYTAPQHDAELVERERANAECFRQIATDLVIKVLILTAPGDELRRASADALERIDAKLATLSAKNEGGKA